MRVYDTALCLLSAHLSSGENEGDELKRNYDYSEVMRRGAFPADVAALDPAALPGQQQDGVAKVLRGCTGARAHVASLEAAPQRSSIANVYLRKCPCHISFHARTDGLGATPRQWRQYLGRLYFSAAHRTSVCNLTGGHLYR